ncbi:hypothetical protein B7494_g5410 [Chlorociboria aeruginascens]|nr:hypothetical protein B7494_g5410 [Chlorociboria aeruginascens]
MLSPICSRAHASFSATDLSPRVSSALLLVAEAYTADSTHPPTRHPRPGQWREAPFFRRVVPCSATEGPPHSAPHSALPSATRLKSPKIRPAPDDGLAVCTYLALLLQDPYPTPPHPNGPLTFLPPSLLPPSSLLPQHRDPDHLQTLAIPIPPWAQRRPLLHQRVIPSRLVSSPLLSSPSPLSPRHHRPPPPNNASASLEALTSSQPKPAQQLQTFLADTCPRAVSSFALRQYYQHTNRLSLPTLLILASRAECTPRWQGPRAIC